MTTGGENRRPRPEPEDTMLAQDLHIHTIWSTGDASVVPEQTVELVAKLAHARVVGISDHFEYLVDGAYEEYERVVRRAGLRLGMEVNGHEWVDAAIDAASNDYFVFHCFDRDADYLALERLLATDKPVILAHPHALETDLERVPPQCLVEINNRYIWRGDWERYYRPHRDRFRFVLSSDAHQPNSLNQTVARFVADALGIAETRLFDPRPGSEAPRSA
jgi:histidinol phosphatase-like PHP family hydrolase